MGQVISGLFDEEARGLRRAILDRLGPYLEAHPRSARLREAIMSQIESYRQNFIAHYGVHDFTRKHGVDADNRILVLSASPSRQSSGRAALVLSYDAQYSRIKGHLFDHLPDLAEVVRNPQRLRSMTEEQKAEAMAFPNRLSLAMYHTTKKKSPLGHTELQKIEPLFNPAALRDMGARARRDTVRDMLKFFEQEDSYSDLAHDIEAILETRELERLERAIAEWFENLHAPALDLIRSYDVPRTVDFLGFLTPHKHVRYEEPHERHTHKTVTRTRYEFDTDSALRRQDLIRTYPLLGWERKALKDWRSLKEFDAGELSSEEAAAGFLGADPAYIHHLAGLDRNAVGWQIHALPAIAAQLHLFDEVPLPDSPEEWKAFVRLLNTDAHLAQKKLRAEGSTIADCAQEYDRFGSWVKMDQFLNPQGDSAICSMTEQLERGMKRIGYSILGSFAYQTIMQRPDVSKYTQGSTTSWFVESMILPLCVPEVSHDPYAESRLFKAFGKERPNLLRMVYDDMPFFDLVKKTRDFFASDANLRYLEMRETWALKKAMREEPIKYGWKNLPDLEGEERLHLRHISNPADLLEAASELESRVGFMAYRAVTTRQHFIRAVDPRTALTRAVATVEELKGDKLRLAFNREFDLFGFEDNNIVPAIAEEQIEAYVARINDMELDTLDFENRRDTMRKSALSYGALRGIIGHDPDSPYENQQAVEVLGGMLPENYPGIGPGGVIEAPKLAAYLIHQVHILKGRPVSATPQHQLQALG